MRRTLTGFAFFAAGLGIAFGGAQLVAGSGGDPLSAAVVTPVSPVVTTTTTTTTTVAPIGREVTDGVSPEVTLSPLAGTVKPLESAFPEVALDGFGEPIGFQPLRLSLPSIDVEGANINSVGLEENGELEIPSTVDVGWYRFGAGVDGGEGSTVLTAHIAYNGIDGVFRRLNEIEVGDSAFVDVEGEAIEYRVTNVRLYDKEALPADLFREDGDEQIVLITCGGQFNPELRSYESNVVVTAVPV
ncbi:MAG: class F sortase [Acidimicrobiales bacterium]|nr:class F sortase [Acidimicrobiales bacterium]RZV48673.1 MAG: class F sortase [Acidimicrobiales bacterium]